MKLTFYGVRGSCPTPGPNTVKYGGNTSCTLIEGKGGSKLILDAGTGIRILGEQLKFGAESIHILLSHNHWDHIQGFPFFIPAYENGRHVNIYVSPTEPLHVNGILEQMDHAWFPVNYTHLRADIRIIPLVKNAKGLRINDFHVECATINHPNGGHAFKISQGSKTVAYITDNELNPPKCKATSEEAWIDFIRGAQVLVHDAQYVDRDMPFKHGWGHSLIEEAMQLAEKAHVKTLILYSHDPERSDKELDEIKQKYDEQNKDIELVVSMEGTSYEF